MKSLINAIYQTSNSFIIKHRRGVVVIIHVIHAILANVLAFLIRFEGISAFQYSNMIVSYLPFLVLIRVGMYLREGLYKDLWCFSSISDFMKIVKSTVIGSVLFFVMVRFAFGNTAYPISVYILDCLLLITISSGTRLIIRIGREYIHHHPRGKKILIVGAGNAGEIIVRDLLNNPNSSYDPIGLIDEDPYKKGLTMHGVPIFGPSSLIPYVIESSKPDEILITTPSDESNYIKKIYELTKPYNIPIKKLPRINDILDGNIAMSKKLGQRLIEANLITAEKVRQALELQKSEGGKLGSKLVKMGFLSEEHLISFINREFGISQMKPISLEDLLQREPVQHDIESVSKFIRDKSVIVTGAGGSIGSELCRQIVKYSPAKLIMLDRYENNLFKIDLELRKNGKGSNALTPVIGDILDTARLEYLFSVYHPQIIFHAAAHKHVPMMEYNPIEAVKNNVLGTKRLLDIAEKYEAENFVMISTDKAVNPTNIMGATKRIAEFLTICMNDICPTKLVTVRFGNVLGSNGSVVKVFKQQLKEGGPLTVTHPEIKRFFMLIPEAVHLVLMAASSGKGGEIFVLDMGKQIRIVDLAENLIRLSGFVPYKDVKIEFIGLRPGEKLYEELFDKSEKIIPTFNKKFRIAIPELPSKDYLLNCITDLENIVHTNDIDKVTYVIQKIVPGFKHQRTFFRQIHSA